MQIEELTKTQIILLTLLVSFVTSIATGIATVALMDQAPADVTRVINRVVERTVETVVPAEQGAAVVTKEKTIVVREDDVVAETIAKAEKALIRLNTTDASGAPVLVGFGVIIGDKGEVLTGSLLVKKGIVYEARLAGGATTTATVLGQDETLGVALLVLDKKSVSGLNLGDSQSVKLGQSVIALAGTQNTTSIGIGTVTSLPTKDVMVVGVDEDGNTATTTKSVIARIDTTAYADGATAGTPLISIFGDVLGIERAEGKGSFVPAQLIKDVLKTLRATTGEIVPVTS